MTLDQAEDALAEPSAEPTQLVLPALHIGNKLLWSRGIRKRRSAPIMGFVGLNGQGKTLCAVRDTLPSLALGRRVLSTVPLLDPESGNPHPLYVPFLAWSQLDDFTNGDILMDEVTGLMDSRDSGMPKKVRRLLPQMRRRNVMIRWTGIDWDNSDRRLRQVTQAVTACRGYVPNTKAVRTSGVKDAVALWSPNRAFSFITYDAQTMSQSDDGKMMSQEPEKKKRAKVLCREFYWAPGSLVFASYNTLDSVSGVDGSCAHVDQSGHICGGRVPDKLCKGHDGPDGGPVRRSSNAR